MFNQQDQVGSGLIERPRLLEKLRRASDHKLTMICAPPGYGKTTLLAEWAEDEERSVAFVSLIASTTIRRG